MLDFTMLRLRLSNGWNVLSFETQKLKNINYFHVTYVIAEFLLVCWFAPKKFHLLAFCLLLHLLNLLLNLDDKAKFENVDDKKLTVRVYWGLEIFIFCLGCSANWQLMLLHEMTSYLAPLLVIGVQHVLLRVWYTERKIPKEIRVVSWFLCMVVTFMPYGLLIALLLCYPGIYWVIKVVFLAFYLLVAIPLMVEFEDSEENLFEFAFGIIN